MAVSVTRAETNADFANFAALVSEYAAWLSAEHARDAWFIEAVLKHQSFDNELREVSRDYGLPRGLALLARADDELAGAVALRQIEAGTCEMKRMFVRGRFRGRGVGHALRDAVISEARSLGYARMVLDTSRRLKPAIALYASAGFSECPAYRVYPEELRPHLYFMELALR